MKHRWWVLAGLGFSAIMINGCKVYYTTEVISPSILVPMRSEFHTWSCPEWVVLNGEKMSLTRMPRFESDDCFYYASGNGVVLPAVEGK